MSWAQELDDDTTMAQDKISVEFARVIPEERLA